MTHAGLAPVTHLRLTYAASRSSSVGGAGPLIAGGRNGAKPHEPGWPRQTVLAHDDRRRGGFAFGRSGSPRDPLGVALTGDDFGHLSFGRRSNALADPAFAVAGPEGPARRAIRPSRARGGRALANPSPGFRSFSTFTNSNERGLAKGSPDCTDPMPAVRLIGFMSEVNGKRIALAQD